MSHTGRSILVFSAYLGILGVLLIFFPGPLLALLGLPPAKDYWILVAGMLLVGLSTYYGFAAYTGMTSFMKLTAIMRTLILPYFLVLVFFNKAPFPIIVLGIVDLLFASWTFLGLKLDQSQIRSIAS